MLDVNGFGFRILLRSILSTTRTHTHTLTHRHMNHSHIKACRNLFHDGHWNNKQTKKKTYRMHEMLSGKRPFYIDHFSIYSGLVHTYSGIKRYTRRFMNFSGAFMSLTYYLVQLSTSDSALVLVCCVFIDAARNEMKWIKQFHLLANEFVWAEATSNTRNTKTNRITYQKTDTTHKNRLSIFDSKRKGHKNMILTTTTKYKNDELWNWENGAN